MERDAVDDSLLVDGMRGHTTRDHRCHDQEEDDGDSSHPLQKIGAIHVLALLPPVPF